MFGPYPAYMEQFTFTAPVDLMEDVNQHLSYGDSRSGWVRESIRLRLEVDDALDDRFGDHEPDARREFVVEAVQEKLEREDK